LRIECPSNPGVELFFKPEAGKMLYVEVDLHKCYSEVATLDAWGGLRQDRV